MMEARFRSDFSRVRIHVDDKAAASAERLDAVAYATGRHIVFGRAQYAPGTEAGRRLLAHELAHVVQQGDRGSPALTPNRPLHSAEAEADYAADAVMAGLPARVAAGSAPVAIYRQQQGMRRANRFLPNEKEQLRKLGRGELDSLIDQIIADGAYHKVHEETIDGVLHVWEVKTAIVELSEQEQFEGAKFGGAIAPERNVTAADGKTIRHQETFILRGGRASTITSALHELIHLRIMIDRHLPPGERSSFYEEYAERMEMAEVLDTARFGKQTNVGEKSSYGALPIATGLFEREKAVFNRIGTIRSLYIGQDPPAEAAFDKEPTLTPAALIEFLVQEKYVTQTAAAATSRTRSAPSNEKRRYAHAVADRFAGQVSAAGLARFRSGTGQGLLGDAIDQLALAIRQLYDAMDAQLAEAKAFAHNPPSPPANMPDPRTFEWPPATLPH
jgi:hypothetical protein